MPFAPKLAIACLLAIVTGLAAAAQRDADYAARLGERINRLRSGVGLSPLGVDPKLASLAREHSVAMANAGRPSHDGFQSRFGRSGYALCVENVGWNYRTARAQVAAWRKSAGHDRNLRDRRVTRMGVGAASGYVTWIACRGPQRGHRAMQPSLRQF
jgi:uncharacterized protein YkwD